MRVVAADGLSLRATGRHTRSLNIELLGLAAASVIVLFGISLTYAAKTGADGVAAPESVVSLPALSKAADLEPALTVFDNPSERRFVARAIFDRARSPRNP